MNQRILTLLRNSKTRLKAYAIAQNLNAPVPEIIRDLYELRKAGLVKSWGCCCSQTFTVVR